MVYHCFVCKSLAFVVAKRSFIVCFLLACSLNKCISGQVQLSNATDESKNVVAPIGLSPQNLSAVQPSTSSTGSDPASADEEDPDKIINEIFGMSTYSPAATEQTSTERTNASSTGSDPAYSDEETLEEMIENLFPTPCNNGDLGMGECTHYYKCSDNRTILTDGSRKSVIIFRSGTNECSLLMPCCSLKSNKPKAVLRREYVSKPPAACGLRNRNGIQVVIKDPPQISQEAEFPWTVTILKRDATRNSDEFLCGGSLIHPQVVMTAAHFLVNRNVSSIFIRAGEWDPSTDHEFFPHQDRDIQEIIVHEHFHTRYLYNDIALLVLKSPVEIMENVNTICLPPLDHDFSGQQCSASGWTKLSWKGQQIQSIIKHIELPVVEHSQCETQLRNARLGNNFSLHESFICAGGEKDVDICVGAGGSPLACPIPGTTDQYYQSGIVSWAIECISDSLPAVYVSIPHLRKWIDDQMIRKNFDISAYDAEASKKIVIYP